MGIDAKTVVDLMERLGAALTKPTRLCLIGSAPALLTGQTSRQTGDIGVWNPGSDYDATDLRAACRSLGILFDPTSLVEPDNVYVQIVRPGVVKLPEGFEAEEIARLATSRW